MPSNWSNTGSTCVSSLGDLNTTAANIDLDPAETITCTFTNQLQTGNIIVDKVTVPATGEDPNFDFTASWLTANAATSPDFSLDDNDTPFDSGPLNAGTYSVAEINIPTDWTKTGDTCVSDAGDPATSAAAIDSIPTTITCTFTNTKDASLIVRKTSVGGTAEFDFAGSGTGVTADFDITTAVAGTPVAYPTFEFDGGPPSEFGLKEVGETPETGYDLTDISCTGDTTGLVIGRYAGDPLAFVNGGSNGFDAGDTHFRIDIGAGENVTCTFTNTKDASLIVRKTSVGGTAEFDFAGSGTGVTADFDITTAVAGTPVAYPTFEFDGGPPSEFGLKEVGETPETGYDLTDISCTGDTTGLVIGRYAGDPLAFVNGGSNGFDAGDTHFRIDIGAGENVTCTFTNTKDASLIVRKTSVGGTAEFDFAGSGTGVTADFDITTAVAGTPVAYPTFEFDGGPPSEFGLKEVGETPETGYDLTDISCTGDTTGLVIGRYAGDPLAFVNGGSNGFDAGDTHFRIDIGAGENVTCTFTNTKDASLIVRKTSVGGTAEFDFAGSGTGVTADFDITTAVAGTPVAYPTFEFDGGPPSEFGLKEVGETPETGYDLTDISCTGDTTGLVIGRYAGDPLAFVNGGSNGFDAGDTHFRIDIGAGENVTCTFTNTKDASLIVRKTSVGGTAEFDFAGSGTGVTADFDITTAVAGTPVAYPTFEFDGGPPSEFGLKEVGETPETGYDLTDISCTGDTTGLVIGRYAGDPLAFVNGGSNGFDAGDTHFRIDIGAGENVTCTFTNTKDASLIVRKTSVGGTAEFDFAGSGTGVTADFDITTAVAGTPVAYPTFEFDGGPPSEFGLKEVGETPETGYDLTDISCTGDTTGLVIGRYAGDPLAFVNGGSNGFDAGDTHFRIDIGAGENVTCTFTNTVLTKVRVIKTVDQRPMVEGDPDITFKLRYASVSGAPNVGNVIESGVASGSDDPPGVIEFTTELLPGDYLLCEVVPFGFDTTLAVGTYGVDWWYPGIDPNGYTSGLSNEEVCIPFTLPDDATDTSQAPFVIEFSVDNDEPGLQRTIGYWKNWSECSGGNQADILGQTLAKAPGGGILVGNLFVNTCQEAVSILSKTPIDSTKNKASDPAFNAAAQFLAHQLNILMPAEISCTYANESADILQAYLQLYGFNGLATWSTPVFKGKNALAANKALASNLNLLGSILDHYNNDTMNIIGGCGVDVESQLQGAIPVWTASLALPY